MAKNMGRNNGKKSENEDWWDVEEAKETHVKENIEK